MQTIIQYAFIAVVFIVAIIYVVKLIKDSLNSKKSCSSGCGSCESESESNTPTKNKG